MLNALILLADEPTKPAPSLAPLDMLLPVAIALLFYFVLWRPIRRQDQEKNALLRSMKKNDEVLTHSGIYGTIVDISEKEDKVTVRIADNVRVRMTKNSIARNLTNEEATRAPKAASEAGTT
jgi:preprotein translocase subunit YajC